MFLEYDDTYTRSGQQQSRHQTGRAAADDTTVDLHAVKCRLVQWRLFKSRNGRDFHVSILRPLEQRRRAAATPSREGESGSTSANGATLNERCRSNYLRCVA